MKKTNTVLIAAAVFIGLAAAAFSTVNMQDGSWEMTVQTDMPGMPFKMPPVKYTACLTKDNPNPQKQDSKCRLISSKIQGNTYSWVTECDTKNGVMKSDGSITYRGSALDGIINATTKGMQMKQKISGRRLGPCAK